MSTSKRLSKIHQFSFIYQVQYLPSESRLDEIPKNVGHLMRFKQRSIRLVFVVAIFQKNKSLFSRVKGKHFNCTLLN